MATYLELQTIVDRIVQDDSLSSLIPEYINQAINEIAGGMQSALGDWITPPLPNLFVVGSITTDSEDAAYTTYNSVKSLISSGDTLVFTYNTVEVVVSITGDYSTLQTDINIALTTNSFTANDVIVSWSTDNLILTCSGTDISSDTIVGGIYTDIDTTNTTSPTDTIYVAALPYVNLPDDFHRNVQFVARLNGVEIDIAESFIPFAETYPALDRIGTITEVSVQGNLLYYQSIPTEEEDLIIHYYKFPTALTGVTDVPDYIPSHLQIPLITNHVAWKLYELIEDGLEGPGLNTQRYMGIFYNYLKTLELTIPYMRRGINLLYEN